MDFLRRLLANCAALTAPLLATAASSSPETAVPALLIAALAALFIQTWADDDPRLKEVGQLLTRYGTLEQALKAIAGGVETCQLASHIHAAQVLELLHASDERLHELFEKRDEILARIKDALDRLEATYGMTTLERALAELEAKITARLEIIQSGVGQVLQGQDRLLQGQAQTLVILNDLRANSRGAIREEVDAVRELVRGRRFAEVLPLLRRLQTREWERLEPESRYHVLACLGLVHHAREEFPQAADAFIDARQFNPFGEKPRCFEAIGYHLRGDRERAFELASQVRTDFPDSSIGAAVWIRAAPEDETLTKVEQAIPESLRNNAEVAAALADRATMLGDSLASEKFARVAFAAAPDTPDVAVLLGNAILQRVLSETRAGCGDETAPSVRPALQEAITHFSYALDSVQEFAPKTRIAGLFFNRATAHRFLGESERFEQDLISAFTESPTTPEIALRYALHQGEKGNLSGAQRRSCKPSN